MYRDPQINMVCASVRVQYISFAYISSHPVHALHDVAVTLVLQRHHRHVSS